MIFRLCHRTGNGHGGVSERQVEACGAVRTALPLGGSYFAAHPSARVHALHLRACALAPCSVLLDHLAA